MKRVKRILLLVLCLCGVSLCSCSIPIEWPTETWVSEDEKIVIDFSAELLDEEAGTIEIDGEIYPIYLGQDFGAGLEIYDASDGIKDINGERLMYANCRWLIKDHMFQMKVIYSEVENYPKGTKITMHKQ